MACRWKQLGEIWRRGGDSNPRYRFWPVQRFSKPPPSASRPPLRRLLSTSYHTALLNLVHSRCTLVHQVYRSLELPHRCDDGRVKRLDVAILRDMRLCMTQDALDDLLIRAQFIQVRCDAATEPVPAVPVDLETLDDRTDDSLSQLVEVHVLTRARVKHHTRLRIADGASIRIQNFPQLSNDRDGLGARACLRLVYDSLPDRAFHVQGITRIIRPFQPA